MKESTDVGALATGAPRKAVFYLAQCELDVASARWHVNDEVVQISPAIRKHNEDSIQVM